MDKIKKIAVKSIVLIIDILCFGLDTLQQVILPNRSRRGNILSSILCLFTGLSERIISFEKNIFRSPLIFRHRYVKQAFILVAGFLFLVSSIEWSVDSLPVVHPVRTVIALEQAGPSSPQSPEIRSDRVISPKAGDRPLLIAGAINLSDVYREHWTSLIIKRYLRYNVLLI